MPRPILPLHRRIRVWLFLKLAASCESTAAAYARIADDNQVDDDRRMHARRISFDRWRAAEQYRWRAQELQVPVRRSVLGDSDRVEPRENLKTGSML